MLGKIIEAFGDSIRIELQANIYDLDNLMGKNVIIILQILTMLIIE